LGLTCLPYPRYLGLSSWTYLITKPKYFRSDMLARPTLPWVWQIAKPKHFAYVCSPGLRYLGLYWLLSPSTLGLYAHKPTLPWVWLTAKSKFFGSDMFGRPTLPWTWMTTKLKFLGLACSLNLFLDDIYL